MFDVFLNKYPNCKEVAYQNLGKLSKITILLHL